MILSAQTIRDLYGEDMISPFFDTQQISATGLTYGLSSCGYDIRIDRGLRLNPGEFALGSTIEQFSIPNNLMMRICDKSTWARRGIFLQTTVAEPGWHGYLTLEITNQSTDKITIEDGDPIAQVIFELLDQPTDQPYKGKYQGQRKGPQPAIMRKK
jgi:dCTP deaminase